MSAEQCLPNIRPETRALKELSAAKVLQGQSHYDGTRHMTLLLLQSDCDEWPSVMLLDKVLQPVDKVVLLVAITIARQTGGVGYLPTQKTLATMANVSSPDTVWRAVSILRCTRWLVACQRMYCQGGVDETCAYAVCSRPLPLPDTHFLDPDYVAFLEKSTKHGHGRVRAVASLLLSQLNDDIRRRHSEQRTST